MRVEKKILHEIKKYKKLFTNLSSALKKKGKIGINCEILLTNVLQRQLINNFNEHVTKILEILGDQPTAKPFQVKTWITLSHD